MTERKTFLRGILGTGGLGGCPRRRSGSAVPEYYAVLPQLKDLAVGNLRTPVLYFKLYFIILSMDWLRNWTSLKNVLKKFWLRSKGSFTLVDSQLNRQESSNFNCTGICTGICSGALSLSVMYPDGFYYYYSTFLPFPLTSVRKQSSPGSVHGDKMSELVLSGVS